MTTVGRWSPNKVRARVLDGTWPEPLGGMVLMKPTSVDKTGASSTATIGTNGSVTFSACESLSLNGVFTTDYDNYMIVARYEGTQDLENLYFRLRASGSDASGSNYTRQNLWVTSTTVSASRLSSQTVGYISLTSPTQKSGFSMNLYGPYLAQPTASRSVTSIGSSGAMMYEEAVTHSLSTSYDGITFSQSSTGNFTGLISVYGLVGT